MFQGLSFEQDNDAIKSKPIMIIGILTMVF